MDIQLEKTKLIEWLTNLKDESVISKLNSFKNSLSSTSNWADDISQTEKLLINAGLKDIEEENTFTHQQVMEQIKEIYDI
jgi:hypothetical protein